MFTWMRLLAPYVHEETEAFVWYGRALAGLVPDSCGGSALFCGDGLGLKVHVEPAIAAPGVGSEGSPKTGFAKSKAEVRFPQTERRQALMTWQFRFSDGR